MTTISHSSDQPPPCRHLYIVTTMFFLGVVNIFLLRDCLSLTITQMVKFNGVVETSADLTCPFEESTVGDHNETTFMGTVINERFDWSEELQGFILGSFYIGYVLSHLPGAYLCERIGPKYVAAAAQIVAVIVTLVTPIVANWTGANGLIAIRIIMGLFQGGFFPAITYLLATWVPAKQRGNLGALVFNGVPLGAVISKFWSGQLIHWYHDWQIVFYYFGVVGGIITALFITFCTNDPSTHPFISEEERQYLTKEINGAERNTKRSSIPFKAILTSPAVLTLIIGGAMSDFAYFVVFIDLPKYMNDVLHVSVQENGVYSSIPYVMWIVCSMLFGYWSDWLIATNRYSITKARKLFITIGTLIDAGFVLAAAYTGCNALIVGIFFALSVGAQGVQTSSLLINPIDIAPNYAATVTGFISGTGSSMGLLVPVVISFLTPNSLQSEWRIVFWLTFWIQIIKIFIYNVWGSGEIQPWNDVLSANNSDLDLNLSNKYEEKEKNDKVV